MGAGSSRGASPMPVPEASRPNGAVGRTSTGVTKKTIQEPEITKEEDMVSYDSKEELMIIINKPQELPRLASKSADESSSCREMEGFSSKSAPHKYEEIIKEADLSSAHENNIHSGIYLKNRKQKYWVEEKTRHNCFMLFARDLAITWSEDQKYWRWFPMNETGDVEIEVPELLNVCWLEVHGSFETSYFTPGVTYEAVFLVMIKEPAYGWSNPVNLRLKFPDGGVHQVKERLQEKTRGQWIELKVGEFTAKRELAGEMEISLFDYEGGQWKRGLVIKGIILRPKN